MSELNIVDTVTNSENTKSSKEESGISTAVVEVI